MFFCMLTEMFIKMYRKDHKAISTLTSSGSVASKPSETSNRNHGV